MAYLLHRPSGYYFRFQIPSDLQPLVSKAELRYSLKTGTIGLAQSRARLLAGQMQYLVRKLRNGHMKNLTESQVNRPYTQAYQADP